MSPEKQPPVTNFVAVEAAVLDSDLAELDAAFWGQATWLQAEDVAQRLGPKAGDPPSGEQPKAEELCDEISDR